VELGIEEAVEELPELVEPSGEEEAAKPATADTNGEKPKARKPSKKK
jgi:hypothetical protein